MTADDWGDTLAGLPDEMSAEDVASLTARLVDLLRHAAGPLHETEAARRLGVTDIVHVRKAMWAAKRNGTVINPHGDLSMIEATPVRLAPVVPLRQPRVGPTDRLAALAGLSDDAEPEPDSEEPALPENLRRVCWCQACGLVFTGVGGFDAHRTGPWDARRCLTPDELRDKGYAPNEQGRWGHD